MKKISLIALLSLLLLNCTKQADLAAWPEVTTESKPWTRWWWMGSAVDSANLTYNLESLSSAGIGGVEITPIYGVKGKEAQYIDYLSPRWMQMLAFTESEATRLGMHVDMNTGTGWPFGGPEVTIEDAATKAIFQEYSLKGGEQLTDAILVRDAKQKDFAYLSKLMAYPTEGECVDLTDKVSDEGLLDWIAPEGQDYRLIALFVGKTRQKVKRAAPGGEGYVLNHFDKEAVMRYFGKFDKAFSENNTPFPQGFFNDSYEVYGADWTPDMLEQFEARRGYRLQDYFPELLAKGETEASVRVMTDFRETIGEILKDHFTTPWTEWAHAHGATTRNQAHGSPANLLDIYASVDIPECESFGISDFDIPGLRKDSIIKKNDGDPAILKYASSAAHVAGKKYTSSETFTWLTEHFRTSLSQAKPEIDQMFTSGVNHVYFHGSTYSPQDAPWPGWKFYASVDMSPTNPYWEDAATFFAYITRVQSFLQSGKPDNDFLLYFPMHDTWEGQKKSFFTTFAIHGMRERLPEFCSAVEEIMACGYDLDYISDHFLGTTVVEKGLLKTEGGSSYKALILPAVNLIPVETMAQIKALIEKGATVVFAESYPSDVPGLARLDERRAEFTALMADMPKVSSFETVAENSLGKGKVITGHDYKEMMSLTQAKEEPFVSEQGGQLIRRSNETGHHYFMTMLQNRPVDGWVTLGVQAKSAMIFDPMTGNKGVAAVREQDGKTQVYLQLKPGESLILKSFEKQVVTDEAWVYEQVTGNQTELASGWELSFPESDPAIEESFPLESLGSWTDLGNELLTVNKGTGLYKTTFDFTKNSESRYVLSLGDVRESARVKVNGEEVATLIAVPFEVDITSYLQEGANTLEVEVTNLPANRIADYDRQGIEWRIFHEINFVSITYKDTQFDTWGVIPSGLLGPVLIQELKPLNP